MTTRGILNGTPSTGPASSKRGVIGEAAWLARLEHGLGRAIGEDALQSLLGLMFGGRAGLVAEAAGGAVLLLG